MTVFWCFLCGAVAFAAGILLGQKGLKAKETLRSGGKSVPKAEALAEEYRNFLSYDGTQQR